MPPTAAAAVALANEGYLADTLSITVRHVTGEKFDRIIRHTLGPKPGGAPQPVSAEAGIAETDIPF